MLFLWWVKRVRQLTFLKAVGEDNGKFLVGRHTHTLLDYAGPHRSGMTGVGYFSQVGSRTGIQENGWKGEVTPHGPSYMVSGGAVAESHSGSVFALCETGGCRNMDSVYTNRPGPTGRRGPRAAMDGTPRRHGGTVAGKHVADGKRRMVGKLTWRRNVELLCFSCVFWGGFRARAPTRGLPTASSGSVVRAG